jgi:hypothetical protein
VGLERGPLSLVITTKSYLEVMVAAPAPTGNRTRDVQAIAIPTKLPDYMYIIIIIISSSSSSSNSSSSSSSIVIIV